MGVLGFFDITSYTRNLQKLYFHQNSKTSLAQKHNLVCKSELASMGRPTRVSLPSSKNYNIIGHNI